MGWNLFFPRTESCLTSLRRGYRIVRIIKAKEFSQEVIFTRYVEEMYRLKKEAVGAERFIAKLLLNSLYGKFGMKQEQLKTVIIKKADLSIYLSTHILRRRV